MLGRGPGARGIELFTPIHARARAAGDNLVQRNPVGGAAPFDAMSLHVGVPSCPQRLGQPSPLGWPVVCRRPPCLRTGTPAAWTSGSALGCTRTGMAECSRCPCQPCRCSSEGRRAHGHVRSNTCQMESFSPLYRARICRSAQRLPRRIASRRRGRARGDDVRDVSPPAAVVTTLWFAPGRA